MVLTAIILASVINQTLGHATRLTEVARARTDMRVSFARVCVPTVTMEETVFRSARAKMMLLVIT